MIPAGHVVATAHNPQFCGIGLRHAHPCASSFLKRQWVNQQPHCTLSARQPSTELSRERRYADTNSGRSALFRVRRCPTLTSVSQRNARRASCAALCASTRAVVIATPLSRSEWPSEFGLALQGIFENVEPSSPTTTRNTHPGDAVRNSR